MPRPRYGRRLSSGSRTDWRISRRPFSRPSARALRRASTRPGGDRTFDLMVTVSLPLLVIVFILQCVSAAIRREPGRLGHAVGGALLGTAGVPLAVAVIATCGTAVDEISSAICTRATADGLKRMVDLGALLTVGSFGGFFITVVLLGWISIEARLRDAVPRRGTDCLC